MITNPSDRIRLFVLKLLGMLTPEEEKRYKNKSGKTADFSDSMNL